MELKQNFREKIIGAFGKKGEQWLADLPAIIKEAESRFKLKVGAPFDLSYNYVAKATHNQLNKPFVLKLGVPNPDFINEIRALEVYAGKGAVKLMAKDEELGAMILSFIDGRKVASLTSAEPASQVMKNLPKLNDNLERFPTVASIFHGFTQHRKTYGDSGEIEEGLFNKAEEIVHQLIKTSNQQVLLHGDLHGGNILHDGKGWIAIDPKGVVGEQEFEPAQFFLNVPKDLLKKKDVVQEWLLYFQKNNGLDPERVAAWTFCKSVLSVIWFIEDNDPNWKEGMETAKILHAHVK